MAALAIPKDADQFPGVHVEIKRKLLVFIESQLGQRYKTPVLSLRSWSFKSNSRRLGYSQHCECCSTFAKAKQTVGNKSNLPTRRGGNRANVADVIA